MTLGVDLAAEAERTAVASIRWGRAGAAVLAVAVGADNEQIVQRAVGAARVGIDCPLGWPREFVDFVRRHEAGDVSPHEGRDIEARRSLVLRRTDVAVHEAVGLWPLSVATDRIGRAAIRAGGLLAALADAGLVVDRSGQDGQVVEVYPAAALRRWGLTHRSYKGTAGRPGLARVCAELLGRTGDWLAVPPAVRELCEQSDDAFDAVVAAVNAWAAHRGAVTRPDDLARARVEGWIAVPDGALEALDPRREE